MVEREGARVEGFAFTDEVREQLRKAPDLIVTDPLTGEVLSLVFREAQKPGEPKHTVFLSAKRRDGHVREQLATGLTTREEAMWALGIGENPIIRAKLKENEGQSAS